MVIKSVDFSHAPSEVIVSIKAKLTLKVRVAPCRAREPLYKTFYLRLCSFKTNISLGSTAKPVYAVLNTGSE